MKLKLFIIFIAINNISFAQVQDNFEDGNLSQDPAWTGSLSDWTISEGQLKLNAPTAGASYLSTLSSFMEETTWDFWLKMDFNPSGSNFVKVYLASDQQDLTQPLNGYFVLIGDTEDEISLYLQQGSETTKIIDGLDDRVDLDPVILKVRVTRDKVGNWDLMTDVGATGNFNIEGTAFDSQISGSNYFGLFANYTSTRADKIYFDDITVEGPSAKNNVPPELNEITTLSQQRLALLFSKPLEPSSAGEVSNYNIESLGYPQSVQLDPENPAKVVLEFASPFINGNFYTLNLQNISDLDGNIINPVSKEFFYFQEKNALPLQIVINELLPDPTPAIGLPEEEFIELYNNSAHAFNLQDWTISDNASIGKLNSAILLPYEYLILTPAGKKSAFEGFGTVIEVTNWPSLNNSGDIIYLKDNFDITIDSVVYTQNSYQNEEKNSGGWSLERIFPSLSCASVNNWSASTNVNGGTPGKLNSIFSDTPDTEPPTIISSRILSQHELQVFFSEEMDEASLLSASYQLQPEKAIQNISVNDDLQSVILSIQQPMEAGANYLLTIENAADCIGNLLQENSVQVVYDISPPQLLEIIFTSAMEMSLLFSEALLPDSAINMTNYLLNNSKAPSAISQPLPEKVLLSFHDEYDSPVPQILTIKNIADLQGNVMAISETSFTYQDQLDTIIVLAENHLVVELNEQPERTTAEKVTNYLLNRSITPVTAFVDNENPKAVHIIFEQNFKHGSWYRLYLKKIFNSSGKRISTPASNFYFDDEAPEIEELLAIDEKSLKVLFNEKIDPISAAVLVNYEINKSIGFPATMSFEGDSAVILNFKNTFLANERYQLEINNLQDIYGNGTNRERQYFVFDPFAPQIIDWGLTHPGNLVITFSEILDPASIKNEYFKLNGSTLSNTSVTLNPYELNKISIHFSSLENDIDHQLEIKQIADQNGNIIDPLLLNFSTLAPTLGKVDPLADSILQLSFSEPISETEALQSGNYQLNNIHPPVNILHQGHQVKLIFAQHFPQLDTQLLTFKNIRDLTGNVISDDERKFTYDDFVEQLVIENENTISLTFELPIEASLVSENSFSVNDLGNPFLILPDNTDENILRLIFSKKLAEGQHYQLEIKSFSAPTGHIIPASLQSFIYDNTPPEITDVKIEIPRQLKIIFSEPLAKASAEEKNFQIAGVGQPDKVLLADSVVILDFENDFTDQQNYTLQISGVADLYGNQLINYSYDFYYESPRLAQFNEIIITEIMANPSASGGLPEVEYIEIYNRSDHDLPVHNLILSDNTSDGKLANAILPTGGYAILCTQNAVDQLAPMGQVISVTNMPGLNNSGETLSLTRDGGGLVFSVAYEESWYKDLRKSQGGWALEMIDTGNPCAGAHNWSASENSSGGTPGKVNSISQPNPDNLGPKLLNATAINENTIILLFNEKISYDKVNQMEITIDPSLSIENLIIDPQLNQLILELNQPLLQDQSYQLTISEAWDCAGNSIDKEQNSALIMLPENAEPGDLVINEILFNPSQGGVEFIEIYNTSEKNILLKNVSIATDTDLKYLSMDYLTIPAFEFVAITEDANLLKANYPNSPMQKLFSVANLPVLNNEESSLVLFLDNLLIDSVYYHKNFHFSLLKDDKGVSLERIYSDQPALDQNNWQSAVSQAGFATPGKLNSQSRPEVAIAGALNPEPRAFAPGDPGGRSFTSLNYQMDEPGKIATITIHDLNGRTVRTLAQNETLATSGSFIWDGTSDQGQQVRLGVYLVIMEVYSMAGDIELYKERVAVSRNF